MIKKTTSQAKSARIAHFQNSRKSINVLLVWNGIWKKFFVWNGIWKKFLGTEWKMEWKKIVGMDYGKIVLHSIPLHALPTGTCSSPINHSAVMPSTNQLISALSLHPVLMSNFSGPKAQGLSAL